MSFNELLDNIKSNDADERRIAYQKLLFNLAILNRNVGRSSGTTKNYFTFKEEVLPQIIEICKSATENNVNQLLCLQILGGCPSAQSFDSVILSLQSGNGAIIPTALVTLFRISADYKAFKIQRILKYYYKTTQKNGESQIAGLLEKCGANMSFWNWIQWKSKRNAESANRYFNEGELYRKDKHFDSAARAYRNANYLWPFDRSIWLALGEIMLQMGDIDNGLDHLNFACSISPLEPQPLLIYAQALIQNGKSSIAKILCNCILEVEAGEESIKEANNLLKRI